ncbi:outer membrane beta-barrel protein [Robiginitalea marina]|uniref:Outer membrane beta-barrel protein n=1 Tax=Robiginitalea marina TaxID=2954105 RepID=A0ABT1AV74_9FLAO|nr:outer membrane beta-barrel protein [Robiginitalea marina]
MKRLVLIFLMGAICQVSLAQKLYVETGQSITAFDYRNSAGGTLDNLLPKAKTFLSAGYGFQLWGDKGYLLLGASLQNYGAVSSDQLLDNYYEWDVTYAGLNTGLYYQVSRIREFRFFIKPTLSLEYLLRGTQTLNNQVFSLSGEDEFDNILLVPRVGAGVQYPISRKAALSLTYAFGRSFSLVNNTPEDSEQLNITMHQISIGISIVLPGCNCAFNSY